MIGHRDAGCSSQPLATGAALLARRVVAQGAQEGRPSRLLLEVDAAGRVHVGGDVVELGRGTLRLGTAVGPPCRQWQPKQVDLQRGVTSTVPFLWVVPAITSSPFTLPTPGYSASTRCSAAKSWPPAERAGGSLLSTRCPPPGPGGAGGR